MIAPSRAGDPVAYEDVPVLVPESYDPASPAPLLVVLHGYSSDGPNEAAVLQLGEEAEARGYLVAFPTGSLDPSGNAYWNATDTCCDFWNESPDHVGYLMGLIDFLEASYAVDADRIHLLGHSNGAFMCFRMACDAPERFASVMPVAGVTWEDPDACPAEQPLNIAFVLEFWEIVGGRHALLLTDAGRTAIFDYFDAHPRAACSADLDGDGSVGASDLVLLITSWGGGGGAADLDGDGSVTVADLVLLIGAWGPCA
ncbi:MAG: CE1 family esterase [Planctomycetota bacterium]|jgi:poly(3-hydroxybutyrate) depolymerase